MELKYTHLKNGLWVYLDNKLIINGQELLGYEIKGDPKELLTHKKELRVEIRKKSDQMIFDFLDTNICISMKVKKDSLVVSNPKMTIFTDKDLHVY